MPRSTLRALVFTGEGADTESSGDLRSLLSAYLSVRCPDQGFAIEEAPDGEKFQDPERLRRYGLVAFPGGRDLGFVAALGGSGMSNLRQRIRAGGCGYVGVCAGAYFACDRIQFACGQPELEVAGSRLGLFPGLGLGPAFPGFEYDTLAGALAVQLRCSVQGCSDRVHMYFNGGPTFVEDGSASSASGTRRLAEYAEGAAAAGRAAVVLSSCGTGAALLFGPHPEMEKRQLEKLGPGTRLGRLGARLRDSAGERRLTTFGMLDQLMDSVGF